MKNVFVPEKNRLANAVDFASGANQVLMHSRILIAFMSAGMAAGSIEIAMDYVRQRTAFKKKLGQFQLMQQLMMESLAKT